ncbi:response regulator [Roseibacillus ishigakijimensis]|uniref:Response regulator transcription factor n=1 Tax=Roseibacillus ishigakijimensis TaxID=454146 RepID=A0A934RSG3_9BACT|nr:response regulator transcription factor [Roseibacillus ishigakijimensis]MBK1834598.1 response regulator transcription factor [Roseibacillus ishigakijimensis]
MTPTPVSLVEDDDLLRETLCDLLSEEASFEVHSVFSNAEDALAKLPDDPPRLVLMDIQLPGASGIECAARLKEQCPDLQILMLTVYDNNDRIFEALSAGANGYLLKRDVSEKLIDALSDLRDGGSPMSSAIARKVVQSFRRPTEKNPDLKLTPREQEILDLLVKGSLYKEIAWELAIGVETVRTHLHNIYGKLHVRTRTEAVVKYLKAQK